MESYSFDKYILNGRAKIGIIVPPTNTVNEAEWNFMAPQGVSVHSTRMPLHSSVESAKEKEDLYADIQVATNFLSQAGLDSIAYGCTAGSMIRPVSELSDYMANIAEKPCVTTAASIVNALNTLGLTKVCLATPYHQKLNLHEVTFLQALGISVVHEQGLGIGASGPHEFTSIAKTSPETILQHIISSDRNEADAIVVSCTDFPVVNMISELEIRLEKPIITSNQATFWACLRAAGISDKFDKFGILLQQY